jgi:thiol-disulfide isomerase/thioredoxin
MSLSLLKSSLFLSLQLLVCATLSAQSISGKFSQLPNQEIRLEGFAGLKTYEIARVKSDSMGRFRLSFKTTDYGVGYLIGPEKKPLFVILSDEDVEISGESFTQLASLRTLKGAQNQAFERYAQEHPKREQALSAWDYLARLYSLDSLFSQHSKPNEAIRSEKERLKLEDEAYLAALPANSYVRWFLPTRKLVSSVSTIAQHRPEEIPAAIAAFRTMDYTDARLYKSGLFKDAIDNHFWLLENCGKPLDSVFAEMKLSIDAMLAVLMRDEKKLNEVTDHLFDLLEQHSLFQASEYLALKVLNETSCTLNADLAKQLETYRAMKKGNTAPEIVFERSTTSRSSSNLPAKLSDLKNNNVLMVFAAGWCSHCQKEVPQIVPLYDKWKNKGLEVVLVSLDDKTTEFETFTRNLSFPYYCDFQKWESKPVKDYYVFGTPTFFLIDKDRKIVLRPNSVKQVDAWVDWVLK